MKKYFFTTVLVLLIFQLKTFGQNLNFNEKKEITKSLFKHLKQNYVLQDSVTNIISEIKNNYKSENFNKDYSSQEFSRYLTELLRTITKDAHFGFLFNPKLSDLLSQAQNENSSALNQQLNSLGGNSTSPASKSNYYFRKIEILDGNVGYLKLERMTNLEDSKPTLDAAMSFLSNSDAFILDLRGNPGGTGGFIPYLMSYFFPKEKILLYKREMPAPAFDSTSYHYTHKDLPGKRLDIVPLYILTNQFTGSAATNLAYTMQSFKKATIIGENTGSGYRGAHSASLFSLPKGLVAIIPIGKVINAKTNTNWREKGVEPNIKVKSSEALVTAHKKAIETLLNVENNGNRKKELSEVLQNLTKLPTEKQVIKNTAHLDKYVGSYDGGRTIWIEENILKYKREGGPALILKFVKENLYKITLPGNARTSQPLPSVMFKFNKENKVANFILVFDDESKTQGPFNKIE